MTVGDWFVRIFPERICGADIDDVLAYPSVKMVRIRDARLGVFKTLLMIGIILYVVLYELAYQGLYLQSSAISGAARLTLQQPTVDSCDPTDYGCKNEFSKLDDLIYCAQTGQEKKYVGNKFPCAYYENIGVQVVMDSSILISTRITQYEQHLVCNASSTLSTCPFLYNTSHENTFYVADAERFTILIDHSVVATDIKKRSNSAKMKGRLYVKKSHSLCKRYSGFVHLYGSKRTQNAPCYLQPNETSRNLDFFSLAVLMEATGTSLDQINYADTTYRETGASMILTITYTNFRNWYGKSQIRYYYSPDLIPQSNYKFYDPYYSNYRQNRTLLNKHGIHIQIAQSGTLRTFLFNNLLVQITTSLTLFAIATVITDFAALYLLPDHKIYQQYKYDSTPDFSDLRDRRAAQEQQEQRRSSSFRNPLLISAPVDHHEDHEEGNDIQV
uniref:Purinergic receptor n=1 Tax=Aureoumbra lagunensis TaxID=44058 RepID=A0A7S3K5J9_9STRA